MNSHCNACVLNDRCFITHTQPQSKTGLSLRMVLACKVRSVLEACRRWSITDSDFCYVCLFNSTISIFIYTYT